MSIAISPVVNNSSSTNFTSRERDDSVMNKRDFAVAFVNMDNKQLRELAYVSSYDKNGNKKQRNSLLATLYAMPFVASATAGIFEPGHLGQKASAAGKMAAHWGFGLLMLGAYSAVKNAIVSKSSGIRKFENEHQLPAVLIDMAAFFGLAMLGFRGADKMGEFISKSAPKMVDRLSAEAKHVKQLLNKSEINKKVLPAIKEGVASLYDKLPITSEIGRFLLRNSVFVLLIAGLVKNVKFSNRENNRVNETYHELKQAQLDTAKELSRVYEIERNVMAQKCEKCGDDENINIKEDMEEEFDKNFD